MRIFCSLLVAGGMFASAAAAQSLRVTPEVTVESRFFVQSPQFADQFETVQGALILSGDARWTSKDRDTRIFVEPYVRLDSQDDERTYADIREASISQAFGDWTVLAGAGQVFWGVAESRNVVDVINQFDTIEDFDQGEKLGQPMIRVSRRTSAGTFEVYYLPYFRKQKFPGGDGRLRVGIPVRTEEARFERDGEEWAGDMAVRYAKTYGKFDIGAHAFRGTSRTPILVPSAQGRTLTPFYPRLTQGGVDVQYTSGPWLLKFEGAGVGVTGDTAFSTVGGFEYTFFNVGDSAVNVGLIGEYLYDTRDIRTAPVTVFENDAFVGTRITLNDTQDTEILAGAIVDTETGGVIASAEFQRRIGSRVLAEIEGRFFNGGDDPFIGAFDRDSHITLRLTRYF